MNLQTKLNLINRNPGYHAFVKYNSVRKFLNLLLTECQRILRCAYLYSYPYRLMLDTNNVCNIECLYCPTGQKRYGRPKGFMTLERFERIIDEIGDYIFAVDLFNWGEPLLHKKIFDMINLAENRNICTSIHSNFSFDFNEGFAERLVMSGLSYLSLSIDGSNQEIYSIYRRKGNFERVLENARLVIQARRNLGKPKPFINWQFLVFPHNKHQIETAAHLANKLGFDSFRVLGAFKSGGFSQNTEKEEDEIPRLKEIEKKKCDWLWTTADFHWDGSIGPCCLQFKKEDDFGSINESSFKSVWNNEKFVYARSLFAHKRKNIVNKQDVICNRCYKIVPEKKI